MTVLAGNSESGDNAKHNERDGETDNDRATEADKATSIHGAAPSVERSMGFQTSGAGSTTHRVVASRRPAAESGGSPGPTSLRSDDSRVLIGHRSVHGVRQGGGPDVFRVLFIVEELERTANDCAMAVQHTIVRMASRLSTGERNHDVEGCEYGEPRDDRGSIYFLYRPQLSRRKGRMAREG